MNLGSESYDYLAVGTNPDYNNPQLTTLGYYSILGNLKADTKTRFSYGKSMKFAGSNNNSRAVWLLPNNPQPDVVYYGQACYIGDTSEGDRAFFGLFNSVIGDAALSVTFMDFGIIRLSVGDVGSGGEATGTVLYSSPGGTYRLDTWFYIELGVTVDPTTGTPTGTAELRLNTVPLCSYVDITTAPTDVTFVDSIKWGLKFIPAAKEYYWDDVYINDDQGSHNNTFLGNVRVQGLLPAGTGANTDFTPVGAATNWEAASNTTVDDSKYVFSNNVGDYDLYTIAPIVNTPTIFAVQVKGAYRQDDATQRFGVNTIKSGATQMDGTPHALDQTYAFQWDIFETDPNTGTVWDYPDVNNLQVGPKVDS